MTSSQSIHPQGNWKKVGAALWGYKGGRVLRLSFTDEYNETIEFSIHYNGTKKNAADLLVKVRDAIGSLPSTERCTCKPDCEEIIISHLDHDE